jgi:large subunit ribosomal protein L23
MALFNVFKKNKDSQAPAAKKSEKPVVRVKKEVKKEAKKAPEKPKAPATPLKAKKVSAVAYRILRQPHITEKATILTEADQYVFQVYSGAEKTEIKRAVEDIYGVKVISVNIVKIPAKSRRLGRVVGQKAGYKKAIVRISAGQKIELLPR